MARDGSVRTLDGASVKNETINGANVVKLTYTVTDGPSLDDDGVANGTIIDPAGLGTARELPATGSDSFDMTLIAVALIGLGSGLMFFLKKTKNSISRRIA